MSLLNKTKKQHIFFSKNIVYVQTKMSHNFLVKIIVRASGQKKKKNRATWRNKTKIKKQEQRDVQCAYGHFGKLISIIFSLF